MTSFRRTVVSMPRVSIDPVTPTFVSRQVASARRFFRDLRHGPRPGLAVVSAGYEQCRGDYVMRRNDFPWYGIELIDVGGGTVVMGEAISPVVPGMVYTYGPSTQHAITASAHEPPGKWYIDLAGADVQALLQAADLAPGRVGIIQVPATARALFELIIENGRRSGLEGEVLLASLARALIESLAHPHEPMATADAMPRATYIRCRAWLERHALHGAGVQEAAVALGLSPAYISRLFQRFDRTTPGSYARRIRLQRAAEQLVGGSTLIQDLAQIAGYADAFHFSRAFTREFGISPSEFRQVSRANN